MTDALYSLGILEGFISTHEHVPQTVWNAINVVREAIKPVMKRNILNNANNEGIALYPMRHPSIEEPERKCVGELNREEIGRTEKSDDEKIKEFLNKPVTVVVEPKRKKLPLNLDRILELCNEPVPIGIIAQEFNRSTQAVKNFLIENGIVLRDLPNFGMKNGGNPLSEENKQALVDRVTKMRGNLRYNRGAASEGEVGEDGPMTPEAVEVHENGVIKNPDGSYSFPPTT